LNRAARRGAWHASCAAEREDGIGDRCRLRTPSVVRGLLGLGALSALGQWPDPFLAGIRQQWEPSGTFLGLPAPSTGTSVKQPKDHSRRSATISPASREVTALAGLFFDI
jgi:hypothetical protein